jgi:hypothetical protein
MHKPAQALPQRVLVQLRKVIQQLGRDGGSMTPSVYGTAQVLRFCPEIAEVNKVIDWLLRRQQADGGWGDAATPFYRDVPTLAALLALQSYCQHDRVRQAVTAAQRFLNEQETVFAPADGEYLPVGVELILPSLLDQAVEHGFTFDRTRFQYVEALGKSRRKALAQLPLAPKSPPFFSWEAWGEYPDLELVSKGGVGNNPTATAWWLHLDRNRPPTSARARATNAIVKASRAAGANIIGVVPDAWPMNHFEQSFVLHLVSTAGLLTDPRLIDVTEPQLRDLHRSVTERNGVGFSGDFEADGDDTAAAVAALAAAGMPVDLRVLNHFTRADRCVSYPFESHGSYTVTARALQAFHTIGRDMPEWRPYILKARGADGWWTSDKWNRSRLYGTWIALAALKDDTSIIDSAAQPFLDYQHADGGWGCFGHSTLIETAFGALALCNIAQSGECEAACIGAIHAAHSYLRRRYNACQVGAEQTWICKDLYSARRIDHAAILCALLISTAVLQQHVGSSVLLQESGQGVKL